MALPRKATTGIFEQVPVNVWDIATKTIVFTGGQLEAANFCGVPVGTISGCLRGKYKCKKRYAIRPAKLKQHN